MASFTQEQLVALQTAYDPNKLQDETYQPTEEQRERYKSFMGDFSLAVNFRTEYDTKWKEIIARYKAEPFFYEDGRAGVVLPVGKFMWLKDMCGQENL